MRRLGAEFQGRSLRFALEPRRFIDETGVHLALTRLYGRAAPGVRVVDTVPRNYGESLSRLAALSPYGLSAPMTVEGAVDAEVFRIYVQQGWGPTLRPGAIVLRDNLAVHKVAGSAEAIRARGARGEYLPPYSPDLTPLEKGWANLKTALRHAKARTRAALEGALKQALRAISAAEARAWFAHGGYPVH